MYFQCFISSIPKTPLSCKQTSPGAVKLQVPRGQCSPPVQSESRWRVLCQDTGLNISCYFKISSESSFKSKVKTFVEKIQILMNADHVCTD